MTIAPTQPWTADRVEEAVRRVNEAIGTDPEAARLRLTASSENTRVDDEWLLVSVEPEVSGVSALLHAERLGVIERRLREDGLYYVTLVPTVVFA